MLNELKQKLLLDTLVFETLGKPEKEREFKIKALKKWGFDLLSAQSGENSTFFALKEGKSIGDTFTQESKEYKITEIFKELPKNKKIYAHIEMMEGRAFLCVDLREDDENQEILRIEAGEILLAFLKKHRFEKIIETLHDIGTAATLIKHQGEEGKPLGFEELPPVPRRFLREAKKIEKEMGFGRIALAYFGENKDKKARFHLSWMVPTIALFDEHIAQKIDKTLAEFI